MSDQQQQNAASVRLGRSHGVAADGQIRWTVERDRVVWDYFDSGGYLKHGVRLLTRRERLAWWLLRRGPRFP